MDKVKLLLNEQRSSIYLRNLAGINPDKPLSKEMANLVQLNDELLELQTTSDSVQSDISLNQILCHSKAFDLFIHHIAKELSIECLLSYVEFIQFKKFMFAHLKVMRTESDIRQKSVELFECVQQRNASFGASEININVNYGKNPKKGSTSFESIEFPPNVPKSSIVYDDDVNFNGHKFEDRVKHKIYRLYVKYIRVGAGLEINISHRSRQALASMIDDYDNWMKHPKYQNLDTVFLMHIFDKSIVQMLNLMQSSFARFQDSKQFAKLSQFVFIQ